MPSKRPWWLRLIAALFWLGVWEAAARWIDLPFAIPTVEATLSALFRLAATVTFWQTVGASLLRMAEGLALGVALGAGLAWLSVVSPVADAIISPAQTVIRATPVASFILLLWVLTGRDTVPAAIAVLMVVPIMWQALRDGYRRLDPAQDDAVRALHASAAQRLLYFVLPSLRPVFMTAFATAVGLAWKAGIAAEIIAYTAHSIGRAISDARTLFDGPGMMAWTLCVIALSVLCETLVVRVSKGRG